MYMTIFKKPIFVILEKKKEPHDVRNFDYTARSWTGKSPKQFLIDWVRKNLPKSPNPSFEKVPVGRYWKCRYVFGELSELLEKSTMNENLFLSHELSRHLRS